MKSRKKGGKTERKESSHKAAGVITLGEEKGGLNQERTAGPGWKG